MKETASVTRNFTANSQSLEIDVTNFESILFTVRGTYNLTLTIEASDEITSPGVLPTNWFPLQMADVGAVTVALTHSTANASKAYEASVHNFTYVRVRTTAFTSGTAVVRLTAGEGAIEPAPIVQVAGTPSVVAQQVATAANLTTTTAVNSAASTNAANVKTSAGTLYSLVAHNATAATKFVRIFNKATAPVPGTDSAVVVVAVPANSSKEVGFGGVGMRFSLGIGHAITNGATNLDATAVAAGDVQLAYNWI